MLPQSIPAAAPSILNVFFQPFNLVHTPLPSALLPSSPFFHCGTSHIPAPNASLFHPHLCHACIAVELIPPVLPCIHIHILHSRLEEITNHASITLGNIQRDFLSLLPFKRTLSLHYMLPLPKTLPPSQVPFSIHIPSSHFPLKKPSLCLFNHPTCMLPSPTILMQLIHLLSNHNPRVHLMCPSSGNHLFQPNFLFILLPS